GGFRIGVSARLAKVALARFGGVPADAVEECWHALEPPYAPLFAWLEGRAPQPDAAGAPVFRPVMLAHPLEDEDLESFEPAAYAAEWKWDGVRVQAVGAPDGRRRLYTRTGDDIGAAFPDVVDAIDFIGVVDGELLIADGADFDAAGPFEPADFAALQKRLNRKSVAKATLNRSPAFVRLYDLLFDGADDLRAQPFRTRRARLEAWFAERPRPRFDLSAQVAFDDLAQLRAIRESARADGVEGLMLKRWDSPYLPGRPKGRWWKWKRAPLTIDAVLMYAQRGHGGRSSFYSDFTFGCWTDGAEAALAPVGKAYSGFTNEEMKALDKWVRAHTVARYGPVREVTPGLVFEVAFDGVQRSTRHRSGVALRFPRIARIRWDKPIAEA
ncbi:MAG: cisplatin damage response ATP-dependent DNA ligase, partial [Pseudomonadota bacterium]